MKFATLVAMIGVSSAQLDVCTSTAECLAGEVTSGVKYAEGGCCATWTVVGLPTDPTWGQF